MSELSIIIALLGAGLLALLMWKMFGDEEGEGGDDYFPSASSTKTAWCFKCEEYTTWEERGDRARGLGTALYRCGGCGASGRFERE